MKTLWNNNLVTKYAALFCIAIILGCGGGSEPQEEKSEATQVSKTAAKSKSASGNTNSSTEAASSKSSDDKKDQKYVDGIPYDVFFDRPLKIASDSTMLAGQETADTPATTTEKPADTPKSMKKEEAATAESWDQIISHEMLVSEIKRIRNKLNANLQSVGSFNRELIAIQIDAATLAAMAGIAAQHSGEFTWKDKAKYVRDFSSTIAMAAESRGRPAFEKAETPFLNIIEILDGGSPAELPDSDDETVFSDVADRNLSMKKVKENQDWLRTTISGEDEMKSNSEDVLARAALLAAIGQVVNQEDYVFADEEDYRTYCRELIEGSLMMTEGAKSDDFETYKKGFEILNKSCGNCHGKYVGS
ncbi:MAG: cytochrome c [Planctomycetaceae bacterium]|nr:cytochrome c [Planctomycetaceae bacterium]